MEGTIPIHVTLLGCLIACFRFLAGDLSQQHLPHRIAKPSFGSLQAVAAAVRILLNISSGHKASAANAHELWAKASVNDYSPHCRSVVSALTAKVVRIMHFVG